MSNKENVLTFGELLVGKSFNPSNDQRVDRLKELFAEAIDILDTIPVSEKHVDSFVESTINDIVKAQMSAVKCIFIK